MSIQNNRVDCPFCGRAMRRVEPVKYLCPKRCLTRPITRAEAASWLKKRAAAMEPVKPFPGEFKQEYISDFMAEQKVSPGWKKAVEKLVDAASKYGPRKK